MAYFRSSLQLGILLLPVVSIVLFIPYVLYRKKQPGGLQPLQTMLYYSFCLYVLCLFFIVSLPFPTEEELDGMQPARAILEPFRYFTLLSARTGFSLNDPSTWYKAFFSVFALNYIMNIVLLIPEGMYLRGVFRLSRGKSLLIILGTTLFIEVSQLTGLFFLFSKPYRHFEVDDLITNFMGGAIGYWLMGKLMPLMNRLEKRVNAAYRKGKRITAFRRALAWAADVSLVIGLNRIVELLLGSRFLTYAVTDLIKVAAELLAYSLLTQAVTDGITLGSWLFRFRVAVDPGKKGGRLRIALRSVVLYGGFIGLDMLYVVLARRGVEATTFRTVFGLCSALLAASLTWHTAVNQILPSRDYPWGALSGTYVKSLPPFTVPVPRERCRVVQSTNDRQETAQAKSSHPMPDHPMTEE